MSLTGHTPCEGYLFAPSSPTLNVRTLRETGYGNGMLVACPPAARERRPDGQAEEKRIGAMALAARCAGRAWPWDRGRRELGRSGDRIAERPSGSGQPVPEPGLPAFSFPQGGLSDTGGVAGAVTIDGGSGSGSGSGSGPASLGSYSGTGSGVAGAIIATGYT